MQRLTPEREKEIREYIESNGSRPYERDLLAEIDALREEHALWEKHGLKRLIDERDALRAENDILKEMFAAEKSVLATNLKLRERIAKLRENITAHRCLGFVDCHICKALAEDDEEGKG